MCHLLRTNLVLTDDHDDNNNEQCSSCYYYLFCISSYHLSFYNTKLCNQIRESTTLLYQIFQRLKMFTIDLRSANDISVLIIVTFHSGAVNAKNGQDDRDMKLRSIQLI